MNLEVFCINTCIYIFLFTYQHCQNFCFLGTFTSEPYIPSAGGGGGGGGGEPGGKIPPPPSGGQTGGAGVNYNPCQGNSCGSAASRPILDNTAVVYVVFGVQGVDRSNTSHMHVVNEDQVSSAICT